MPSSFPVIVTLALRVITTDASFQVMVPISATITFVKLLKNSVRFPEKWR